MTAGSPGQTEKYGLSGLFLKLIALISMTVDHTGAVFFDRPETEALYTAMRVMGRLAFPLYAFLLAEGAVRSRDLKKYLLRLGVFAFVSEIPFDLAFSGKAFDFSYQNVFFTLFFGLTAIFFWRRAREAAGRWEQPFLLTALPLIGLSAHFLAVDYGAVGVLLIMGFYLWRTDFRDRLWFGAVLFLLFAAIWSLTPVQLPALLAFFLILLYNGKPGKAVPRWLFYLYYPAHLLLFALLRAALPA